jgi:hypothetical protein
MNCFEHIKSKLSFLLLLIILHGMINCKAQWIDVGVPVTEYWSTNNIIAADTNGIIYYACTENKPGSIPKPVLKKFDGTSWVTFMFECDTLSQIEFEEALIDKYNQLNVFYRMDKQIWDVNNNYSYTIKQYGCKVLRSNGWQDLTGTWLDTDTYQFFLHASIDKNNNVYCVITTQNNLLIKKWNGLGWTNYTSSGLPPYKYKHRIAFSEGEIYLAILNTATFSTEVYRYNQNQWMQVGNFYSGNAEVKLLNTPDDNLYLTYKNKCVRFNKAAQQWQDVGSMMTDIFGDEYDFRSDEKSNLFVSTSALASQVAKCYYFDGTNWVNIDSRVSENIAGETRLTVNNNHLYVGYNDFGISKAVVRKYELNIGFGKLSKNETGIYFSESSLFVRYPGNKPLVLNLLSIEGKEVLTNLSLLEKENKVELQNLAKGVYVVRLSDLSGSIIQTYKFSK